MYKCLFINKLMSTHTQVYFYFQYSNLVCQSDQQLEPGDPIHKKTLQLLHQ